jgi:hypothetical protein
MNELLTQLSDFSFNRGVITGPGLFYCGFIKNPVRFKVNNAKMQAGPPSEIIPGHALADVLSRGPREA